MGITLSLGSSGPTTDEPILLDTFTYAKAYKKCTTNSNTAAFLVFVLLKEIEPNPLQVHASGGMDPLSDSSSSSCCCYRSFG